MLVLLRQLTHSVSTRVIAAFLPLTRNLLFKIITFFVKYLPFPTEKNEYNDYHYFLLNLQMFTNYILVLSI